MSEYQKLLEQQVALSKLIAEAKAAETVKALAKIKELVDTYALTAQDIFTARSAKAGSKVAPKYRDPATGNSWTGRGMPPAWIAGKHREQFLIR